MTFERIGRGWYRVQLKPAGEAIGIIRASDGWHLIHPRLPQGDTRDTFAAAKAAALAFASELEGAQ